MLSGGEVSLGISLESDLILELISPLCFQEQQQWGSSLSPTDLLKSRKQSKMKMQWVSSYAEWLKRWQTTG